VSRVGEAIAALEAQGEARIRDGLGRYGIVTAERVIGVPMAAIQKVGKELGRDHQLAEELWQSGVYEARLLAAFVDVPQLVTAAQMDRWARDFDNWATVDTLCFKLFDQAPDAWAMVDRWAGANGEWVKRSAYALLASLALHDKKRDDAPFLARMPLIEAGSTDDRNFVKKGVSWGLRAIGANKSPALRAAAREMAQRLIDSGDKTARWIGKDAQRQFAKADKRG
jgi:3-methyladenine DNA glycosylase AlkD